jgi:hypothetical protein
MCTKTKAKNSIGKWVSEEGYRPQILKNSIKEGRQIKIKSYKEVEG